MKKSDFTAIANENKKVSATSTNVDMSQVENQSNKELTDSEKLNAYMAAHAIEHYCNALGADMSEVENILNETSARDGANWFYTCPTFDKNMTKEKWEEENPNAIHIEELGGKHWYKRLFVIGDARGVRSIVKSYYRLEDAKENADKRLNKKADDGLNALELLAKKEGMKIDEYIAKRLANKK